MYLNSLPTLAVLAAIFLYGDSVPRSRIAETDQTDIILVSIITTLLGGGLLIGASQLYNVWISRRKPQSDINASNALAAKSVADATVEVVGYYKTALTSLREEVHGNASTLASMEVELDKLRPLPDKVKRLEDGFNYLCDAVKDGYPVAVRIAREKAGIDHTEKKDDTRPIS